MEGFGCTEKSETGVGKEWSGVNFGERFEWVVNAIVTRKIWVVWQEN
jgi:hypothetical protein